MREKTKLFMYCIKADDPSEFNEKIKAFCQTHDVTNITPFPDFLAYIDYTESENVPETKSEEIEMETERHTCGECPFLERSSDKRRKKLICQKKGLLRYTTSNACEEFYQELKGALNEKRLSESCECHGVERLGRGGLNAELTNQVTIDHTEQTIWSDGIQSA